MFYWTLILLTLFLPIIAGASHPADEQVWGKADKVNEGGDPAEGGFVNLQNNSKICWETDPPGIIENCIYSDPAEDFVFGYYNTDTEASSVVARLNSAGIFDVTGGFYVGGSPFTDQDFTIPWTWDNEADTWWTPIILKAGLTSNQATYIAWQNYLGVDKWYLGQTGSNFQLYDLNQGYPRFFISMASNQWTASDSHLFKGSAGDERFTILGDADTVCIGPNEDTCLTRTGAGIIDYTQAQHTHLDDANAGLLTFDAMDEFLELPQIRPPIDDFYFLGAAAGVAQWKALPTTSFFNLSPRIHTHENNNNGGKLNETGMDLSGSWEWDNNADVPYRPIVLRGGNTSDQIVDILWEDKSGADLWELGKDDGNNFHIYDVEWAIDRLHLIIGGHNTYRPGEAGYDHIFEDYDSDERFRILGDADTVCIGPNEDSCISRASAGVFTFPSRSIDETAIQGHWRTLPNPVQLWNEGLRCDTPAVVQLGESGTQSPQILLGHCSMPGGNGQNGYYFGSVSMPDGWNPTPGISFRIHAIAIVNPTAIRNTRGLLQAQCVADEEKPESSWTNYANWVVSWGSGDTQWEQETSGDIAVIPDGSCSGGDMLYWRMTICDNIDSELADAGCINGNSTANPITSFVSMPIEYSWIPAD